MRIIREAAGVVAVWKPAGLATQAPPGIPSAESWLRQQLHGGDPRGYVGVPHRIDRAVSGVVLFASTPRAARKLSRQFERREVRKTYVAIVACGPASAPHVAELERAGVDEGAAGERDMERAAVAVRWSDLVLKVSGEPRARIAADGEPGAREAVTFARLLRRLAADRLLLQLEPVTGRMHQLRLQAASRSLPMLGDDLYGTADIEWIESAPDRVTVSAATDTRARPIALHALRIAYADPDSGADVTVEAPLPDVWPLTAR